jgi:hypothetical protein
LLLLSFFSRHSFLSSVSAYDMATVSAVAHRHIVSLILNELADMKYKDRRQGGPDQPVELLEYRPTLVPAILVNKLWADEGTSILWKRYPHVPALKGLPQARQQWYAEKVEWLYIVSPTLESGEDLEYLEQLAWPRLKSLELDVDWKRHGHSLRHTLHSKLEHIEISAAQSGDSTYIAETLLPTLFKSSNSLRSVHIGPDVIDPQHPLHNQTLNDLLESNPGIKDIRIMNTKIFGKDLLFGRLSQRPGLEALEIDLDPGLQLLSLFEGPSSLSNTFTSLRSLRIMCYPEVALALSLRLPSIEQLSIDIARIPDQPVRDTDSTILTELLSNLVHCPRLEMLKVNVGQLAANFPSASSLPRLDGESLIKFAIACSKLKDLTLLASEPAAIDATTVSAAQFEQFCQHVPGLKYLSLKLHPGTTLGLEESALQSLGRHCPQLEVLRMKVALQLSSLTTPNNDSTSQIREDGAGTQALHTANSSRLVDDKYVEIEAFKTHSPLVAESLFPNLGHLALARPQTILSITTDSYSVSSASLSSTIGDPWVEEELVRCWAQSLLLHFPKLDILEAWSDWTGHDNDSLNYFLPLQEPLASTWEFLSGIEQDLWDDGQDGVLDEPERWDDDFEEGIRFNNRASGDWDLASLVNEFPEEQDFADSGYLEAYDEESEDMTTPIDERRGWFAHTKDKLEAGPHDADAAQEANLHHLEKQMEHVALHPQAGHQQ